MKKKTKTKTKNEKDPTCAIFLESRGFKDIKYDTLTKNVKCQMSDVNVEYYHYIREGCKKNGEKCGLLPNLPRTPPPDFGHYSVKKVDPHFFCCKIDL